MGLKENLQNETVEQLPMREAIAVAGTTPVKTAVQEMLDKHLGCTVIVDDNGAAIGVFTERSLIDLLQRDPGRLETAVIQDHLDPEFMTVTKDTPVAKVFDEVVGCGMRFIYVIDEEGKPIGVTGQRGISEFVAEHFPKQVMVQRIGGQPGMQTREGA